MSMKRVGMARACALALVVLLTATGCARNGAGDDDPSETPSEGASKPPVDQSREFRAKVHAEGTGAAEFTWDGEQTLTLTRVGGPHIDVNLVSAGFRIPEILPDDRALRFRWAFDLLNAYEDKPGTFKITSAPVNDQGLKSQAFLIWMKVKDPSKEAAMTMDEVEFLKEFREVKEPCTVEIGEKASTGSLTCPALVSAEGEVAGLTVTWEEIAA